MATRSTDVSMMGQCPGRWVLTNFYENQQVEASFFILGTALHETIEVAINMDLDPDWAMKHLLAGLDRELERVAASDVPRIESSKRGFDSMHEDAERMLRNWFRSVHPDSDKRHPIYDEYEWPPRTEVAWDRLPQGHSYPAWGSIDALWTSKGVTKHHAITDWKSGTSRQRSSDQLDFYRFGLGHGDMPAWFHHLDKVRNSAIIQMADPYPGDDAVRQRIIATEAIKEGILEDGHVTFNPDWYCGWCPVQHHCPADGDYRNREQNMVHLSRMLKLARPMETIERIAS
jgi:hypothetical protein